MRAVSAPMNTRATPHSLSASIVNNLPRDTDQDIKDRERQAASHVAFFRRPPPSDAALEQQAAAANNHQDEAIKKQAKKPMTFFAAPPQRVSRRARSFGTQPTKQGSSGSLSIPGSGSFKLLRNNTGDLSGRRASGRTAFEEAVANIELQRQDTSSYSEQPQGIDSSRSTQDSGSKRLVDHSQKSHQDYSQKIYPDHSQKSHQHEESKKSHAQDYGHHDDNKQINEQNNNNQEEDYNQKSIFPSQRRNQGHQDPNPAMPDPMPLPQPQQQPELEYDDQGNVTKGSYLRNQTEGAVAPGAYSATIGAAHRLPTPDNYGQLGQIGEAYGYDSQEYREASKEFKSSLRQSATSTKSNNEPPPVDNINVVSQEAQQLFDTLEEGTERSLGGSHKSGGISVVSGTLMEEGTTSWYQRKPFVLFLLLLVVGLVVAVVVLMAGSNQPPQTTVQGTIPEEVTEAVEEEEAEWVPIIPGMTEAMIEAINTKGSQQERAYNWMSKDPDLDQYEDWRLQQRYALMCFFYGFRGNVDLRFGPTYFTDECQWLRGVDACQGNDRGIIKFVYMDSTIRGPFLQGTVPPELSFLSSLEGIRLSYMDLTPFEELVALESLPPGIESLDIVECEMGGSLPSTLGLLTDLTNLQVSAAGLGSSLPSQLGNLSKLTSLVLPDNRFTGSIPTELAGIPSLTHFRIEQNPDLEPSLPSGFCSFDHEPFETLLTDWCDGPTECCSR